MKRDPYFKYVAAALLAGVLLAFFQPAPVAAPPKPVNTVVASTLTPASVRS